MEQTSVRRKWANWKFISFIVILIAIFVKFYVLDEHDENATVIVALDLPQVAMRNELEVAAILGKGQLLSFYTDEKAGCEKCPRISYRDGKVEIIYINDIADQIRLNKLADYPFENRSILGLLNLNENIVPNVDEDGVKTWDNYQKYTQISAFSKSGDLDYILVKSKSE
ncbi:hypothetical protein ACN9ML_17980 [Dyadobacter endophyticus]|uniref:Uncharacterized protein n=1 Tax=Dyadobacter endophyticus TaxID=1749036 RepID=A0ABQ1Z446_9BACT|nr:hypothetical protein [Dyadobacter endophyticus]GGH47167.1 hypothetical protein GCM10007423_47480 [Dyadobacter endophyticus]